MVRQRKREEDVEIDTIDSFYCCFLFEQLLFVKVVAVAERYFKEVKIRAQLDTLIEEIFPQLEKSHFCFLKLYI